MKMMNLNTLFALLCPTNCGTIADALARYDDCATDVFREFGANHFIIQKCDYEWTDMLSTVEWAAAVVSNDIQISPAGILTINAPTVETFQMEGCGREATGKLTYTVDFTTYQTDAALADYQYWRNLFKNARSYRIFFVDCNQIFFLEEEWAIELEGVAPATVAGGNPGFEFSLPAPPRWEAGENEYGRWAVQFSIKTANLMGQALIPGAYATL